MTHQEFGKELLKYNLCLKLVMWGQDNPRNFNLDPDVKQAIEIDADSKHGVANIVDESARNNFVGTFASDFMYLITIDKNHLPKNKLSLHKVNINSQSEYVVAQIDPTRRCAYQRDKNYQPNNYQLWKLVKSFVATPIVQRDKDDYIYIAYHVVSDNHETDGYDVLNCMVYDANNIPRIGYDTDGYEVQKASEATSFCVHFSLSQIKNYLHSHPLKYTSFSDNGKAIPVGKVIQVKKIISAVKKHLEKVNYREKTIPRFKWDYIRMFNWAFKGHKHQLYIDMNLANQCYQQMTDDSIYQDICDAIKTEEPHGLKLKQVYKKLKTNPKHIILSARQVKKLASDIDKYCEIKGYCNNDDYIWQSQMLDGVRCNLDEYYYDQLNE